jgi:hypothetical protein
MSICPEHFREMIQETLMPVDLWTQSAEELLIGTAAQESHLGTYLFQLGGGPAVGVYQMEPSTHSDIWDNYLLFRPELVQKVDFTCGVAECDHYALKYDLRYQTIMARIHYRRVKEPLPKWTDVFAQSVYWDRHWNRNPDKGFPEQYRDNYFKYVRRQ